MNLSETTVLYLEADDLTRQTVSRRLARQGMVVLPADSIEAGLMAVDNIGCVPVIVLDLELPAKRGVEAAREIRLWYPTAPVIVCGCSLSDHLLSELELLNVSRKRCLCKPCRFEALLSAIREAVEEGPYQSGTPHRDAR